LPQHDREAFRLPINSAIAGNGESYFAVGAVEGIAPAIVTNRGLVIFKRRREDRGDLGITIQSLTAHGTDRRNPKR
jgi:hypothetical protein